MDGWLAVRMRNLTDFVARDSETIDRRFLGEVETSPSPFRFHLGKRVVEEEKVEKRNRIFGSESFRGGNNMADATREDLVHLIDDVDDVEEVEIEPKNRKILICLERKESRHTMTWFTDCFCKTGDVVILAYCPKYPIVPRFYCWRDVFPILQRRSPTDSEVEKRIDAVVQFYADILDEKKALSYEIWTITSVNRDKELLRLAEEKDVDLFMMPSKLRKNGLIRRLFGAHKFTSDKLALKFGIDLEHVKVPAKFAKSIQSRDDEQTTISI